MKKRECKNINIIFIFNKRNLMYILISSFYFDRHFTFFKNFSSVFKFYCLNEKVIRNQIFHQYKGYNIIIENSKNFEIISFIEI